MRGFIIGAVGVVLGALITGLVALIGSFLIYKSRHREIDVKMIEIALGILSEKPIPDTKEPLRDWAVKILMNYSKDVPLDNDAQAALRSKPLPVFADAMFSSAGRGHMRGVGAVGASGELSETPLPLKTNEGSSA